MTLSSELQKLLGDDACQFYRCYKCHGLISAIELAVALNTTGIACKCGSMKIQPTQVLGSEYVRSNVIDMAVHLDIAYEDYIQDFLLEHPVATDADIAAIKLYWLESEMAFCN